MFKLIILIAVMMIFIAPTALAQDPTPTTPTTNGQFTPNVPIGSFKGSLTIGPNLLGQYFQIWYGFTIGAVGVIATVIIMWGGFKWLTSRGNPGVISDAKEWIWGAVIGLILVFLSYSILNIINPRLLTISLPTLDALNIPESNTGAATGLDGFQLHSQAPDEIAEINPTAGCCEFTDDAGTRGCLRATSNADCVSLVNRLEGFSAPAFYADRYCLNTSQPCQNAPAQ